MPKKAKKTKKSSISSLIETKHTPERATQLDEINKNKINDRQDIWIDNFLLGCNRTEAARIAGYAPKNCQQQGSYLYRHPVIRAEIARRTEEVKEILPSTLVQHLANVTFFNVAEFMDADGTLNFKKIKQCKIPGMVRSIKEQYGKTSSKSIGLTDQLKAAEILARLLQLFNEMQNKEPVSITFSDQMEEDITEENIIEGTTIEITENNEPVKKDIDGIV